MELKFDSNGLIPAVVTDYYSKAPLMLAYMNAESLKITMEEGRTCFFSRSRQALWRKGETSGNRQNVVSIRADCDLDALMIEVIKDGPACHTGAESCFFNELFQSGLAPDFSLEALFSLIKGRKTNPKEGSYTTYLFQKGPEKILKKIGEEATEVVVAGMKKDKNEIVFEIADLAYHLMVLMADADIEPSDVFAELSKRHVVDKKVKQETMK